MEFAWDVDREGDVSLVRCRVRNGDAVPRRVRIESHLDAPVLPPRRGGVPEDGWDETGVALRLGPGERRALGFAARAPPTDPPVEVTEVTATKSGETGGGDEPDRTASATATALRQLDDHRPPRDVVTGGTSEPDDAGSRGGSDRPAGAGSEAPTRTAGNDTEPDPAPHGPASPTGEARWVDAVGERLDAVESRIDRAERLTDADLATATAVVGETNGVEDLSGLDERVAADAAQLRELSERASALAARAEATDAPIEALERLA